MARQSKIIRNTQETQISVELNLDSREYSIKTQVPFLTHMLEQFAKHGCIGLQVEAKGDIEIDDHHLVEDTGIVLGLAFKEALAQRQGIKRYGMARVPMDDALLEAVVDLTTRPYLVYEITTDREFIGRFDVSLAREFWYGFVNNCGLNLHITQIRGENAHHIIEASFKAVTLALKEAISIDPLKSQNEIPSTKGLI